MAASNLLHNDIDLHHNGDNGDDVHILLSIPDVILQHMIQYMTVRDIFHLIASCRTFYQLSQKELFWIRLLLDQQKQKQLLISSSSSSGSSTTTSPASILSTTSKKKKKKNDNDYDEDNVRLQYLLLASSSQYHDVKWYQTSTSTNNHRYSRNDHRRILDLMFGHNDRTSSTHPTSREGHLACRLGSYLVITGGFTPDDNIYIKQIPSLLTTSPSSIDCNKTLNQKKKKKNKINNNDNNNSDDLHSNRNPWIKIEPIFIEPDTQHDDNDDHHQHNQQHRNHHNHEMTIENRDDELHEAYGATLTPLDNNRAIRFGGFQSGGYSMESCQVALLTLTPTTTPTPTTATATAIETATTSTSTSTTTIDQNPVQATWKIMTCSIHKNGGFSRSSSERNKTSLLSSSSSEISTRSAWWYEKAARAYHTATLLYNRYLLIIGGMQSDCTILSPLLLDTYTWIWYYDNIIDMTVSLPSPRFGHSVIEDYQNPCATRKQDYCNKSKQNHVGDKNDVNNDKNNNTNDINSYPNDLLRDVRTDNKKKTYGRLLMFGGGNGSDLLRSGEDFIEIWELDLHVDRRCQNDHQTDDNNNTNNVDETIILQKTLPWTFRRIYRDDPNGTDSRNADNNTNDTNHDNDNSTGSNDSSLVLLSPSEKLVLGRCHMSYKISNDIVILMFGSGRPTTNGILGFHLKKNQLFRYNHIWGVLPVPRFTFGSIYLQELGYIIIHSGYSTQLSNTVDDICVLDIAPHIEQKQRGHVLEQIMFTINTTSTTTRNVRAYPPVSDDVVQQQYSSRYAS